MKLAMLFFAFAGLLLAGSDTALYSGTLIIGAIVSGAIGFFIIAAKANISGGGIWWIILGSILYLAVYWVTTNGGQL
jgi:hypothetical protein